MAVTAALCPRKTEIGSPSAKRHCNTQEILVIVHGSKTDKLIIKWQNIMTQMIYQFDNLIFEMLGFWVCGWGGGGGDELI